MTGPGMNEFEAMVRAQTAAEKQAIHDQMVELPPELTVDRRKELAVELAHHALSGKFNGGDEFGYEIGRNAAFWWNYTAAYLRDLTHSAGRINDHARSTQRSQASAEAHSLYEQVTEYGELRNHAGDRLIQADAFYILAFDALERMRVNNLASRHDLGDPFTLQTKFAHLVLSVTISHLLDRPEAEGRLNDRHITMYSDDGKEGYIYRVKSVLGNEANKSAINELYKQDIHSQEPPELSRSYYITESDSGITASFRSPDMPQPRELSSTEALDAAGMLGAEPKDVFARVTRAIPRLLLAK